MTLRVYAKAMGLSRKREKRRSDQIRKNQWKEEYIKFSRIKNIMHFQNICIHQVYIILLFIRVETFVIYWCDVLPVPPVSSIRPRIAMNMENWKIEFWKEFLSDFCVISHFSQIIVDRCPNINQCRVTYILRMSGIFYSHLICSNHKTNAYIKFDYFFLFRWIWNLNFFFDRRTFMRLEIFIFRIFFCRFFSLRLWVVCISRCIMHAHDRGMEWIMRWIRDR